MLQRTNAASSSLDELRNLTASDWATGSIGVTVSTDRASVSARLLRLLADASNITVLGLAASDDAECLPRRQQTAVLVLDCAEFGLHERSRLQRRARSHFPGRVLWLTDVAPSSDRAVQAVVDAVSTGWCHGYIASDCDFETLVRAITAVARQDFWLPRRMLVRALREVWRLRDAPPVGALRECGRSVSQLTVRERQVLELVHSGLTNKEIGRRLGIEEDTVKKHLRNMYAKLGVHRRAQMLLRSSAEVRASG